MSDAIRDGVNDLMPRLVELRHELHANPELGYAEHDTSRRIAAWLGGLGGRLEVRTGLARGTGIVATLNAGKPGPTVALRADMDAIAVTEETGLDYASRRAGVMHACGHDGHMACLAGAVAVCCGLADEFVGTIKFVFQPSEEAGRGAEGMIADGVLENPAVSAMFGLHGWPARKVGQVAVRAGAVMASTDTFQITVHGRGTHGANPHQGLDPIVAASHVVTALQAIVSRTLDPVKSGVVTVGQFHAGTAMNVIPPTAELVGTIRALDAVVREHLRNQVEQVARHTAAAFGCRADVRLMAGYPMTVNDAGLAALVGEAARDVVGAENVDADQPASMGGEDFSLYAQRVPACYFFVGTCPRDREEYPAIHSPTYDFSDESIRVGTRMLCEVARRAGRGA